MQTTQSLAGAGGREKGKRGDARARTLFAGRGAATRHPHTLSPLTANGCSLPAVGGRGLSANPRKLGTADEAPPLAAGNDHWRISRGFRVFGRLVSSLPPSANVQALAFLPAFALSLPPAPVKALRGFALSPAPMNSCPR